MRRCQKPSTTFVSSVSSVSTVSSVVGNDVQMKPRIAITVGDPAGIGPEIAHRAAADPRVLDVCEPVLFGPAPDLTFPPGVLSAEAGRAAYEAILRAVKA